MKKLIALFAILVAMTSFSFAADLTNSATATSTVHVWNPMTVEITVGDFTSNILTGGSVTIPFILTVTADNNDWSASANSITASNGSLDVYAFSTTGYTAAGGASNGNKTENLSVTYTNNGTAGTQTVTATYTAQYTNL
jgi:hypothetical protein